MMTKSHILIFFFFKSCAQEHVFHDERDLLHYKNFARTEGELLLTQVQNVAAAIFNKRKQNTY